MAAAASVYLQHSFCLKQCLLIALEVSGTKLSNKQYAGIKDFTGRLKHGIHAGAIEVDEALRLDLLELLQGFRNSHTYNWIREDFHEAVYELDRKLHGLRHSL